MIEMGQGGRVEGWGQVGAGWAGLRDWVGVGAGAGRGWFCLGSSGAGLGGGA